MTSVTVEYISSATNRHPYAADSSPSSLVAFGCQNSVALLDAADQYDQGVFATLAGHQGLVTCVRFASNTALISADELGLLCLWKRDDNVASQWRKVLSNQAHNKAISALCVLGDSLITGSSDASLKVWKLDLNAGLVDLVQTIDLKNNYPISLSLSHLPNSSATVLAVGCTHKDVQIWTRSDESFVQSATLPGHEDWIRSLAFCPSLSSDGTRVLASGSQDATIRLWTIETLREKGSDTTETQDDLIDAFEAQLGDLGDSDEGGKQISLKRHIITVKTSNGSPQQYSISFDALLIGHEAGVTSLAWQPQITNATPTLLSTSVDSSVVLWSPQSIVEGQSTSIWISRQRFGDIGGQRLGGFVGCLWAENRTEVLAHGWSGGWRRWRCENRDSDQWSEVGAIGGHNGPVKDVNWAPNGDYIISAGLDQTTRIHGPVRSTLDEKISAWHELARPQIHGYDLVGAVFLSSLRFASVADEKVARIFEAPKNFVRLAEELHVSKFAEEEHSRPESAMVPPLGLSNKASEHTTVALSGKNPYSRRPFEGELASVTLWPEAEKIFGHGYESVTIAVSHSSKFIATACKASTAEHAVTRVYKTGDWQPFGSPLHGHNLTITRIAFSPDDKLILTVSRDRTWRLFELQAEGYVPVAFDKSHSRIIWDCSWSHEGDAFATGSRDKTLSIWAKKDDKWSAVSTMKHKEAVTAVAFSPTLPDGCRRLAVGLENGEILIYKGSMRSTSEWSLESTIPTGTAHTKHIHAIAWQPIVSRGMVFASCSEDGTVKVFRLTSN